LKKIKLRFDFYISFAVLVIWAGLASPTDAKAKEIIRVLVLRDVSHFAITGREWSCKTCPRVKSSLK
jgi:hypothetical protein